MRYVFYSVIALVLAPFLLTPVFLVAIAAGPVLASLLLMVSTGLLMFAALKLVSVAGSRVGRLALRVSTGARRHRA